MDGIGKINPYEARRNSLYQKVSKEELSAALYHLVKEEGLNLMPQKQKKRLQMNYQRKNNLVETNSYLNPSIFVKFS
ncbi:hypothetical protein ACI2OX_16855 [Bacillus sp. N9]